jgi:hypothetical protein
VAQVTITVNDEGEDHVSFEAHFEPKLVSGEAPTMAQLIGLNLVAHLTESDEEEWDPTDLYEDEDEEVLGIGAHAALSEEELE